MDPVIKHYGNMPAPLGDWKGNPKFPSEDVFPNAGLPFLPFGKGQVIIVFP